MAEAPVTVRLSDDLKGRLSVIADDMDRSPHYLIKHAVEAFVTTAEVEKRENALALQRLEEYRKTGKHVTHEKVLEWASRLPRRDGE